MKGVPTIKGVWCGSGRSGRKARRTVERRIRRATRKILARQN